jgi:archaellum component FlaC
MKTSANTQRHGLIKAIALMALGCIGVGGCTASKAELKQEIEALIKHTRDEIRVETRRMDADLEQIRAEVGRLRSQVGRVEAHVGRMETHVSRIGSEVSLLQSDAQKNDASLVDLAVRVNQLDRRVNRTDQPVAGPGEGMARVADESDHSAHPPLESAPVATSKALQHGMTEQEVLRLFGHPHGIEKVLDSVYWYYGDGDLQGEYVKFDAKSGRVNGWSGFAPEQFQLELLTTQGGHVQP